MPLEISVQLNIIFYSFLSGIITGILFDEYRIIRGSNGIKIIFIIEDILFWTLTAIIIFIFLLYNSYAFLGMYVYLFIIISLGVYFKFISKHIIIVEKFIGKVVIRSLRVIFKHLIYPIKIFMLKMGNKSN
ncbi:MAG: spore cortex biosynthesis protein YabQ [Clostridium sp.]|jgi:spore cortex biosynthesis protein yabQ|nr:spore cortex biosynthesis protein YabQ [Clostridium sp.]